MFRAFWFLIQLFVIVAVFVWMADQPGSVVVEFMGYTVTVQFGIGLVLLTGLILFALLLYRLFHAAASIPALLGRRHEESVRQKGYRAMTRGFAAVAAGHARDATFFAKQTRKYLPDEKGLPLLLEAQAARLRGEEGVARRFFNDLLKDRDAAFFGIRGLLKSSLDEGDQEKALDYARQALALNPRQPWILQTVYDLELQNRAWPDALRTGKRALKAMVLSKERVRKDEVAILLHCARLEDLAGRQNEAISRIEKAYALDRCFVPTIVEMLKLLQGKNKKRKAKSVLEKAWKKNPHPDLIPFWEALAPDSTKNDPMRKLKWYEKVLALRPDSVEGQIAAARAAIEHKLWGAAKAYLAAAEKIQPQADIYRLYADIEKQTTKNENVIQAWLEKAADAPAGKVWYCTHTGHIYDRWSAIAEPHGAFNTIEWGYPRFHQAGFSSLPQMDALLIEPAG